MLVKNWMSTDVVTVHVNDSMQHAVKLIKERGVKMLPVLENGKLVGVVTDRDLKRASASDATTLEVHELLYLLTQIKVKSIMTKKPITVSPLTTVEETARILLENDISGAPVVDEKGDVVGTITQKELFGVIISLTGVGKKGIQFGFLLDDRPGSIKDIADTIREYSGRMASILSSYERAPEGKRHVYIRMYSVDRDRLNDLKEDLQKKATILYMVDEREDMCELFEEEC
ncbi:CBS and ACT domain-containing protein [Thermodesulfobacteriota bacterium]